MLSLDPPDYVIPRSDKVCCHTILAHALCFCCCFFVLVLVLLVILLHSFIVLKAQISSGHLLSVVLRSRGSSRGPREWYIGSQKRKNLAPCTMLPCCPRLVYSINLAVAVLQSKRCGRKKKAQDSLCRSGARTKRGMGVYTGGFVSPPPRT